MQTQLLGELLETVKFARQVELNRTIEGVYPISKLARLSEALLSNEGFITARLEFGHCAGYACLKGRVYAALTIECQRCLKPIQTEITGKFKFALINSEDEFELLPEELEPYLIEGEKQSIIELIEEELLLSLPMVTVHKEACSDYMSKQNSKIQADIKAGKETSHPFAALKALKGDKVKSDKVN